MLFSNLKFYRYEKVQLEKNSLDRRAFHRLHGFIRVYTPRLEQRRGYHGWQRIICYRDRLWRYHVNWSYVSPFQDKE